MYGPISARDVCAQYKLELDNFQNLPLEIRALYRCAYSADVLKVEEEPHCSNRGPEIDRYLRLAGTDPGQPWCAAFVTTELLDSGAHREKLPKLAASVHSWLEWAIATGRAEHEPERGYAGLIIESPTAGHMVMIGSVLDGGKVATIEGNTNTDGSRDGYGVFRRVRPIGEFRTFVNLSNLG